MKLLNAGCGKRFREGWVNIDFAPSHPGVIACDFLRGIPFENDFFDVVYHSHILEHFSKTDGETFLRECNRVLKSNGVIRVVVPDLEKIAREYLQRLELALQHPESPEHSANHEWLVLLLIDQAARHYSGGEMQKFLQRDPVNHEFVVETCGSEIRDIILCARSESHQTEITRNEPETLQPAIGTRLRRSLHNRLKTHYGLELSNDEKKAIEVGRFRLSGEAHLSMYDRFSLPAVLKKTGFVNITRQTAEASFIKDWKNYNLDTEPDGSLYKPESMYFEARKEAGISASGISK